MGEIFIIGRADDPECAETAAVLERFGVKPLFIRSAAGRVAKTGIIILINAGDESKDLVLGRECIGIAADGDLLSLNILKRNGCRTVTCGFSPSCSVTLSGTDGDRAAVGIQRDLISIGGRTVGAREIPVTVGGISSPFAIMAAVAAVLASDRQIN